ncbi:MAG: NAD(+)/NADH kinase [Acidimicrobiia bacterium]|nr:NAD(+)/NADH kinase [Acidimicrobiia bacterium]
MSSPPIGLLVNPRSGSDVRRAVAAAGSSTFEDKISIIRRVVLGALEHGVDRFVTLPDHHRIVARATDTIGAARVEVLDDVEITHTEDDSRRAAIAMRDRRCLLVVVLGGDGTNRVVAKGWPDAPLLPMSTGTNNAFPYYVEPTVAGSAVGLLGAGIVELAEVATPQKVIAVAHGDETDLALIDAVAVDDPYVGSLELFDPHTMRLALLARADPAAIGFSAAGGLIQPLAATDPGGLVVELGPIEAGVEMVVRAPTAPGHYSSIGVRSVRRVADGEPVMVDGPVLLAFDGERKRRIAAGESARMWIEPAGPRVIDVPAVMAKAAAAGAFVSR